MIDQVMFLMGNILLTSKEIRSKVRANLDLVSYILQAIDNCSKFARGLPRVFASNFVWVANTISKDSKTLDLKDIQGLARIFYEFVECFTTNQDDEVSLIEVIDGMLNLSKSTHIGAE